MMIDFRPILLVNGWMLVALAAGMLIPAGVDTLVGHEDWQVFFAASLATGVIGGLLVLAFQGTGHALNTREAFLMIISSWLVIPAFGALPFAFADLNLSLTDSLFEAVSGITTTGSTVINGLDDSPPGLLLWRAILQWLGGIGIIVMAITVFPLLQIGGMQLFRLESSDTSDKAMPRARQIATAVFGIYISLTALWAVLLMLAGMSAFDGLAHAMTTIATGGYSTRDGSIGAFDSVSIDLIITLGMIIGSLPFILYMQVLRGRPLALWRDAQVQWFFGILLTAWAALISYRVIWQDNGFWDSLRHTSFNLTSIMTGTGYATADYNGWGPFAIGVFFIIMFVGGCAGSTSCGVKVFRVQVMAQMVITELRHLIQPHGIFKPHFNGKPIQPSVMSSVMNYFFLFFTSFLLLSLLLSAAGLDFLTAASAAGTALANVGPGLGDTIGPAGNFANLPDFAKWVMMAGMVLGRLELIALMVLFSRAFWRG